MADQTRGARRPCRGVNSNVCVAEGCYGEACLTAVAAVVDTRGETGDPV